MTIGGRHPENTDFNDIPPQWIDPETAESAGRAQALADAGNAIADTDGDGVSDAGEFIADTDPLNPLDYRTLGRTEDYDPNFREYIDDGTPDDVAMVDDGYVSTERVVTSERIVALNPAIEDDGLDDIVA